MDTARYAYLYDGTIEGMLHAVSTAIKSQKKVKGIYPENNYQPQLFISTVRIRTDQSKALKLMNYLQSIGGDAARYALNGFLSEDREVGTHLYYMVQELLQKGTKVTQCYTHDSVRYLAQLSSRVIKEAHRFTGLIRFRILDDGLQYAPIEPDCNVIGYCVQHFQKRLRNTCFILHDIGRDLAFYWDGNMLREVQIDADITRYVQQKGEIPQNMLNDSELYFQDLWKSFHQAISIKSRENLELQCQRMPQRYWKFLVEKL